jgi:hypothetical protein
LSSVEASKDLGRQIMSLRYDLVLEVLTGIAEEARRQAEADTERNRYALASNLDLFATQLERGLPNVELIVKICKPYIEEEKNVEASSPELWKT